MKIRRMGRVGAIIPTASMADIAFLLIIFFMVTTTHENDRTSVNLPTSLINEKADQEAAIVVIHNTDEGALAYKFSDGKAMSQQVSGPGDIYLEASRITRDDPNKQFALKADGDLPYEKVDELLEQMRRGGVRKVLLLTQPAEK